MNHFYEEIDEHIQWLINFMNEDYPNNYELVIDNNSGTIRSTLQAQMFLRNDLRNPEGFRKATEKPINKFVEKLAEVAKEYYENETNAAYEDFLMAFYDGHIAIYVDNKETADILYRFCWDYPIEMDYPNGEGCGIQIDYTYKVAFVEYVNRHTGQKGSRRILLRYKGKNDACGVDILNAGNVFKED